MEPWVEEFFGIWQKNRVEIAQLMLDAWDSNPYVPVKGLTLEDALQIFDGAFAMMQEELTNAGNDVRETYMNSVVPGFLAQGQPLEVLVGSSTMNAVLLDALLAPKVKEAYRGQISRYIASFYMKLNMEMIKIAFESGAAGAPNPSPAA